MKLFYHTFIYPPTSLPADRSCYNPPMPNKVKAMNRTLRRSIFWIFVSIFAVSSPLLVLYTSGYRYNIASGQILRTGVISIATDPRSVSIFVNDELQKSKTPTVVKRLMPDTYSVRLEKDGYLSWSGEVKVFSGATSIMNTILLFLDSEPEMLFNKEAESFVPSPDGSLIAYTAIEEDWEEVWLYDLKSEEHKMIAQRLTSDIVTEIKWSTNSEFLSVYNYEIGLSIFAKSGTEINLDIEQTETVDSTFWHPSDGNTIFLASETGLEEINLSSKSSKIIKNTDENSISLDASILNFFDDGSFTELMQLIDGEPTLLALLPRSNYTIAERDGSYMLLTDDNERLILLDIHAEIPILLETKASIYDWTESKNLLVYSDGYEVNVYDPGPHTNQFITRQGDRIESLLWHSSATSILFQLETKIVAHEHYNAGDSRKNFTLVSGVDEIKTAWVASDGQMLYYYAFQNGSYGLYKLELIKPFISL
ncbi:hypothetical protein CO057_03245 [Candidatus Uhrbacteria bacterium CG_4_9_14_0_2_um_filter_41_50]|uniref:PEGA domain-containing protein n=1 Tax=Candidatus Uhrbacteria bacterium CG_4_9_14_0_2_um_filter_41_50 TaxID=1975031 RepID=A0A2M8ENJ4_9BACT|nr:MAG: hypothetical protein COZ45_03625 [Candidatus Uhrbacteria bacterium CG_4_10_14_3_um_filter_41_21]PIZ55123.1 MAG: hypothetical protein COY24_01670 [Candidatus Uhrbacteria bacterium CG_4_10_14_0_2_um_filter_41_21]PJB84453.1 MAG: hypothetical protein CO086_03795 [Candidatus Uhrbacteria bacterium CG_4_9_14_0_8_um_filter_41_16]PJC24314.1 MAG: hypothetical protein CO057_03245 [Candidatus Uhrbacteria bacterium CG_4_9_14_0_2_um_filter_41_50]PJE75323.1 MAG: hypothetical protein COV03_00960 [Candi